MAEEAHRQTASLIQPRAMLIFACQVVEARHHRGRWQFRLPGARAWCEADPHSLAMRKWERQFLADIAKVLRLLRLVQAREARRVAVATAKAADHAAIVEGFKLLALTPRPMPERSRAAVVAESFGCSARQVRRVMADWRKKSGQH